MLTTSLSSIEIIKPSPKSDVLFQVLHNVFGQDNRHINPKAIGDAGTPIYASGLTIRCKFVCHTDTFTFPGLAEPTKSVTLEHTFRPVANDGTWDDAQLAAYNACAQSAANLGRSFGDYSRKVDGTWSPEVTQKAFDAFQNFALTHRFALSPKQEPYWGKDEDGRKFYTRDNPTTPPNDRSQPIADPALNSAFLDPLDSDTPDA
jgi:hypothetical protein